MNYIGIPLTFTTSSDNSVPLIERNTIGVVDMIDNLVELVVFTPRGTFDADPDFGFEYWNHEFSNVNYREFNNDQVYRGDNGMYNDVSKRECQESIVHSLAIYAPQLKQVNVGIELSVVDPATQRKGNCWSKYMVTVIVSGLIDNGLGTTSSYNKSVSFLMEPTAKKNKI